MLDLNHTTINIRRATLIRMMIVTFVVLGLTLGTFPFSSLTDITKEVAAACDKDKETSKDKDKGQTS